MSGQVGMRVRPRRVSENGFLTAEQSRNLAAKFIMQAGFVLVWESRQSEATYYNFPGRVGTLRIASHKKGGSEGPQGPTLVSATFPEGGVNNDGVTQFKDTHVENHAANAIGLYLIRAKRSQ